MSHTDSDQDYPRVTLLDMKVVASQEADGPLRIKVVVTREFMVENTTADQAIAEVMAQ